MAMFPLGVTQPPKPIERFDLASFSLPVALSVSNGAGTAPTAANFNLKLWLSGQIVVQVATALDLFPLYAPPWMVGNGVGVGSLQTPIAFRPGQTLQIGFDVQLDQGCAQLNVALASIIDPTTGTQTPNAGSIGYVINSDDWVLTP